MILSSLGVAPLARYFIGMLTFRLLVVALLSAVLMTQAVAGAHLQSTKSPTGVWISICAGGVMMQMPVGLDGKPIETPIEHLEVPCQACLSIDILSRASSAVAIMPEDAARFLRTADIAILRGGAERTAHPPRAPPYVG